MINNYDEGHYNLVEDNKYYDKNLFDMCPYIDKFQSE